MSKKFIGKDIEAFERHLGITQNPGCDEGKKSNQRNGAEEGKVGNRDGEISAFVLVELFECGSKYFKDGKVHLFLNLK